MFNYLKKNRIVRQQKRRFARVVKLLSVLRKNNPYSMHISYAKTQQSDLAKFCDVYGSDKGEVDAKNNPYNASSHTYTDFYELLFEQKRQSITHVLECVVGRDYANDSISTDLHGKPGASLRAWRDYFPNAKIVGLDIDEDVLFTDERITTYQVDQTDPASIRDFLAKLDESLFFDIIIDDGLHEFHAARTFFENIIERLADDGVYVIEGISASKGLPLYDEFFSKLTNRYYVRFVNLVRPNKNLGDNSLVVINKKNKSHQ